MRFSACRANLANFPIQGKILITGENSAQNILYKRSHSEPDNAPLCVLDEAPFPLWIVPPGWRMARLSSIVAATGYALSVQDAGVLLTLAGVLYAPSLDLWGWKEVLITWHVDKTGDALLLWRRARV